MPTTPTDEPLISAALAKALELAPEYGQRSMLARAVNIALQLDWTDAKWRGIFKTNPGEKFLIDKRLGSNQIRYDRIMRIPGKVRGVVVNDTHAPFHDRNAIRLACKVIGHIKPDVLIFNGDLNDMYSLSRFDKNPERKDDLQGEIDIAQSQVLIPLSVAAPKRAKKIVLPGNHDIRFERYLWRHPELFGLTGLNLPSVWQLDRMGIEYAGYAVEFDGLHVSHGTRVSIHAGYAAKAELTKRFYQTSTMTGHNHRNGAHQGNYRGRMIKGQEVPCLCDLNPEYQDDPNWSQGIGYFEIGRDVHIECIDFHSDYTCRFDGKWFEVD